MDFRLCHVLPILDDNTVAGDGEDDHSAESDDDDDEDGNDYDEHGDGNDDDDLEVGSDHKRGLTLPKENVCRGVHRLCCCCSHCYLHAPW